MHPDISNAYTFGLYECEFMHLLVGGAGAALAVRGKLDHKLLQVIRHLREVCWSDCAWVRLHEINATLRYTGGERLIEEVQRWVLWARGDTEERPTALGKAQDPNAPELEQLWFMEEATK